MISLKYDWERPTWDAILETDDSKLPALIAEAESRILARVDELNRDHLEERSYLATAIVGLQSLKHERGNRHNGDR